MVITDFMFKIGNLAGVQILFPRWLSDPDKRAELYKKVYGECCDTPQTQIIS